MDKPTDATIPANRPWYRLHLSTWLILPLGLVAAVLVVLPGGIGRYPERPSWVSDSAGGNSAVVHGWPLPFLWRTPDVYLGSPLALATTRYRALPWKFTDSVREFRLFPLAVDLLLAGIGVALFAASVEWRRRRMRPFQFALRELLIITPLVAIALAWWGHRRATDRELADRLGKVSELTGGRLVPCCPLWLRALVGDGRLSWIGINGPPSPLLVEWDRSRRQDIQHIAELLPQETTLVTSGTVSSDDAAAIAGIERLEQIESRLTRTADLKALLTCLRRHPHLRKVSVELFSEDPFGDGELAQIATLPQLGSLKIIGRAERLTDRGIAELRNCSGLRELEIGGVRLTQDGVNSLGGMKQLRRLSLGDSQFINADLSALRRIGGLEDLDLSGTNFDDDDARLLRTFPSLRCLSVQRTQLTKAGFKELLDPSPTFSGHNLEQIAFDADLIDEDLIAALKALPRLRVIFFALPVARLPAQYGGAADTFDNPELPKLILEMKQALPDRDIDWTELPFVVS